MLDLLMMKLATLATIIPLMVDWTLFTFNYTKKIMLPWWFFPLYWFLIMFYLVFMVPAVMIPYGFYFPGFKAGTSLVFTVVVFGGMLLMLIIMLKLFIKK